MFNLLPDILKEELKAEYKRRRLIVALILFLFLELSFLVFIFPTWLISRSKEREISSDIELVNGTLTSKDASPITSVITGMNMKLNFIDSTMQYPGVLPFIDVILSNKILSIRINEIFYTLDDQSAATITLAGVSSTREALVSFVKKLEDSGSFQAVNLPVSNFRKDKNIDFSISMTTLK